MEKTQTAKRHFEEFSLGQHPHANRGDALIRIHISRNMLLAIIFSILLHALILFLVVPNIKLDNKSASLPKSLEVSLAPPKLAEIITPIEKPVEELIEKPVTKHKVTKRITQITTQDSKPETFSVPEVPAKPQPSTNIVLPKENATEAPTDMASYVKAMQAKRLAAEGDAAKQNAEAVAREAGLSTEQIRDERIKNNFKNGTNGIFEITSLDGRRAGFSFRGWTNDYSNSRREYFEVEAGTGQDVRLVMIRKMISLIRLHYQGDFNWESQRLGRTVVQSARPEDNAGLEDFMMMEFFGSNYKKSSQ